MIISYYQSFLIQDSIKMNISLLKESGYISIIIPYWWLKTSQVKQKPLIVNGDPTQRDLSVFAYGVQI